MIDITIPSSSSARDRSLFKLVVAVQAPAVLVVSLSGPPIFRSAQFAADPPSQVVQEIGPDGPESSALASGSGRITVRIPREQRLW